MVYRFIGNTVWTRVSAPANSSGSPYNRKVSLCASSAITASSMVGDIGIFGTRECPLSFYTRLRFWTDSTSKPEDLCSTDWTDATRRDAPWLEVLKRSANRSIDSFEFRIYATKRWSVLRDFGVICGRTQMWNAKVILYWPNLHRAL